MNDWIVRSAAAQDVESVLGLWVAAGSPSSVTDTSAGLLALLAADREALLLAELDRTLVGSLIAAWDGWRGSFYRLAVHPDHQRRGIGTALLQEGERRLQARGAVRLTAIVAGADSVAVGFWESAGYGRQDDQARFVRVVAG